MYRTDLSTRQSTISHNYDTLIQEMFTFDSEDCLSGGVLDAKLGHTYTPLLGDVTDEIAGGGTDLHLLEKARTPTGIAFERSV